MPGIIAGYWANWGLDNRCSTYRIPYERGAATRIENRMPCGSANPYLAAAAMLNAALLGVVDGLDCGLPQVGDGDAEPNTDRHTPHSLAEAIAAFEADTVLCEAMGADLTRAYLALRRDELARWEAQGHAWSLDEVTPGSCASTCRSTDAVSRRARPEQRQARPPRRGARCRRVAGRSRSGRAVISKCERCAPTRRVAPQDR